MIIVLSTFQHDASSLGMAPWKLPSDIHRQTLTASVDGPPRSNLELAVTFQLSE